MMKRFSLTASSHLPAMASCTASSAYCERGLRCSLVSAFKEARSYGVAEELEGMLSIRTAAGVILLAQMRRWGSLTVSVLLALGAACGSTTSPSAPRLSLSIGVDLPVTGREARAAMPAMNGVRFFVKTHPVLDGFDVVLTTSDDARDGLPNAGAGVSNVQKFIADSAVVAMIGPFDAWVARKEIPIANAAGLAMVSPATSNPCLTRDVFIPALLNPARAPITCQEAGLPAGSELRPAHTNNFFRLTTTDELQGAAAADYLVKNLHLLRAAAISDHEAYGQGLADAFMSRLTALGGTVTGHLDLDPARPDAASYLTSMKDAGAQAIYYGGGTPGGGCPLRGQMKASLSVHEATPLL